MLSRIHTFICSTAIAVAVALAPAVCQGSVFDVVVDTFGLAGADAVLAFDFIDGGPPSNSVTLGVIAGGTQGGTATTGDVSGTGPWTFGDSQFFNELLVSYTPLGTGLSFSFTTTDNTPDVGSFPDGFAFYILDPLTLLPIFDTTDPTQSGALFVLNVDGSGPQGLNVYSAVNYDGVALRVTTPSVIPEPGPLGLLVLGLTTLYVGRRMRRT